MGVQAGALGLPAFWDPQPSGSRMGHLRALSGFGPRPWEAREDGGPGHPPGACSPQVTPVPCLTQLWMMYPTKEHSK